VKLITAQEEVELARRIKQGDNDALKELTNANLRFVVSVAKQYQGQGLSLPDLINEGNLGLIKAASRFDETRGFKFISYAVWWIRQSILKALAEQGRIVRLPLNKVGSMNKIGKAFVRLEQEYERPPTEHELAEALEITLEEVKIGLNNTGRHVSLDAPLKEEGGSNTLMDTLEGDDRYDPMLEIKSDELKSLISRSLAKLTKREADIISLYFGLDGNQPCSHEEIGDVFGLTRERVRQLKEGAIRRLRSPARSGALRLHINQ